MTEIEKTMIGMSKLKLVVIKEQLKELRAMVPLPTIEIKLLETELNVLNQFINS